MKLALKALQKMAKYFSGFVIALLLAGCEMSQEEKNSVAAITCSIMSETRNMDGAVRVEKINEAREKIGGKAFLSGDDKIKESFELGLCETLVVDPDQYKKMVTAIEAKERQIERERKIAWKRAEEKRIARTRDALEEWKSAILDRINSASDIIKDATFDVSFSDDSPIKIEYNCSFMKHLDHTLIVSFDNELGYLLGRNSVGSCSGSQKIDAIKLDFEDSDRENLYSVIDSVTRGSLLHSVISVDLKINDSKITDFIANNAKQRAEFKYVDPTNFHPDLRNGDLRNSPIVVRIYDAEKARIAEKNRVKKQKAAAEQRAKKLADELAAKKRKIAQVIRNYRLTAVEELKKYTFTKGKSGTTKFNDGLEINIDPNPLLRRVRVIGHRLSDTAQQPLSRVSMSIKNFNNRCAEAQVCVTDDTENRRFAVSGISPRSLCRSSNVFSLTDRSHWFGSVFAIVRTALDEYRTDNVVPGCCVRPEVFEFVVGRFLVAPQMMMGIDDRPLRVDNLFLDLFEPPVTHCEYLNRRIPGSPFVRVVALNRAEPPRH